MAVARQVGDDKAAADALLFLANMALHLERDPDRIEQLLMEPESQARPPGESNLRFTFLGVAARLKATTRGPQGLLRLTRSAMRTD